MLINPPTHTILVFKRGIQIQMNVLFIDIDVWKWYWWYVSRGWTFQPWAYIVFVLLQSGKKKKRLNNVQLQWSHWHNFKKITNDECSDGPRFDQPRKNYKWTRNSKNMTPFDIKKWCKQHRISKFWLALNFSKAIPPHKTGDMQKERISFSALNSLKSVKIWGCETHLNWYIFF